VCWSEGERSEPKRQRTQNPLEKAGQFRSPKAILLTVKKGELKHDPPKP
jgi:hypothetical protein